jgi:Gpi18-like mannosyltransferase
LIEDNQGYAVVKINDATKAVRRTRTQISFCSFHLFLAMTKINSTDTVLPENRLKAKKWVNSLIFVIAMWFFSRLLIVVAMQVISPLVDYQTGNFPRLPMDFVPGFVPKPSWELFSHWDGKWYKRIATIGYDFAMDGEWHSIAFFPLFPLLSRGVMTLGLPFEVAATLVNNLSLLGAMFILYLWAEERHGIGAARWSTAMLAWCPLSLYGTVIYTEGLFLLLTTAALRAFDNRQHGWAALWGAMATATRGTGITLVPTFLFVAWRERRPASAYVAGLAASVGLLLFILFCAIRFGDPLAFAHVQQAWDQPTWLEIFHSLLYRHKENWLRVLMVFGGIYLLWHMRRQLSHVAVAYGFFSMALIVTSGVLGSVTRYVYGTVSISLALGILLSRHQRWGYALIGFFSILLVVYTIRFAWWQWVA